MSEDVINDKQYSECIKCIEYFQTAEYKNEPIGEASLVSTSSLSAEMASLLGGKRKDVYKRIWAELEGLLKCYQDASERHRILYNHVRNMLISSMRSESVTKNRGPVPVAQQPIVAVKTEDLHIQM